MLCCLICSVCKNFATFFLQTSYSQPICHKIKVSRVLQLKEKKVGPPLLKLQQQQKLLNRCAMIHVKGNSPKGFGRSDVISAVCVQRDR